MKIYSSLILLSILTIAIASPLLPANSVSLFDFTNFQQLDPVSNVETDHSCHDPGWLEQTQPCIPSIPTLQGITGPPITDSSLDEAEFQPSYSSNSDIAGSSFEQAGKLLPGKSGPKAPAAKEPEPTGPATVETIYLCCKSTGEDIYTYQKQSGNLIFGYCLYTVYQCPKGRQITSLAMECQDKSVQRAAGQSDVTSFVGAVTALFKCVMSGGLQYACIGLPLFHDDYLP